MTTSAQHCVTPFCTTPDVHRYYQGPLQDEALARLHFLVDRQCRLGLIVGGTGLGKSLLLEVFAHQLVLARRKVLSESLLGLEADELLDRLLLAGGSWSEAGSASGQRWQRLTDMLRATAVSHGPAVVLLDDASEATSAALMQITRLVQLPRSNFAPTVVLTVDSSRLLALGERLLELVELRVNLDAWELTDTQRYLAQTLERAGHPAEMFQRDAIARVHELAGGIPRRINQLADLALLAALAEGLPTIDRGLVDAAFDELSIVVESR